MEGFFAVIISMGVIQLPEIELYWSSKWVGEIPFFGRMFARKRFEQMFWMLHVSRDDPTDPGKRINKVKDVLQPLISNFQRSYQPGRNLAVDETMVGFRGRFGAKQYMPAKPTKYGIKAFTLADSENGYLLGCLVYTGRNTLDSARDVYSTLPQPARIVLHVSEPYLGKGHSIYTDRYYTSIPLVQALAECNTDFTGTVRKNRLHLPDAIHDKTFRLADNEVVSFRNDRLLTVGWRAPQKKKPVIVVSSDGSAKPIKVRSRATGRLSSKPTVVDAYNQSMNGVDTADQFTVYYSFVRKSKKWWRKLFFWLFKVSFVNNYILYKTGTSSPSTHLQYCTSVVNALSSRFIATAPPRPRPGRPCRRSRPSSSDPERLNPHIQHFLGKRQQRECVVCSDSGGGRRRRTAYYCKTCPSCPSLCPDTCFEQYHTRPTIR